MGIDFGEKRVGVAVSDEKGTVAFPREVFGNDESLLPKIASLAKNCGAATIVLGESKNYKGDYNPIMEKALLFKIALERSGFEVELEPEFLTSAQAKRSTDSSKLDASAAAIILQSYLDRKRNGRQN